MQDEHFTTVVIGSGFGGTVNALSIASEYLARKQGENVLILERGTWWTTPVGTVQDKEVKTFDFLASKEQPVQYWSSVNHLKGAIDIFLRCFRRPRNPDGLYDLTRLGTRGFWGLFRRQNDGVSILTANGVGGGSLVYSNITIRPPELIFKDARWNAITWSKEERDAYYDVARESIGKGVLNALDGRAGAQRRAAVNTGLSNIVTRTGSLNPHWVVAPDPLNQARGLKRIDLTRTPPAVDASNDLWIDRARVFQTAMDRIVTKEKAGSADYGTVDLAINDFDPANPANQFGTNGKAANYCERQGRCNVGCLPGARHTLNKQLMAAALGKPDGTPALLPNLTVRALCEVDVVRATGKGYAIDYDQFDPQSLINPGRKTRRTVTADMVVVAAGCLGTSQIMLRSKQRQDALPELSDEVGAGFSTNGDYIAFLEKTRQRVSLTRGPVTTSFGHFKVDDSGEEQAQARFHTIEDQGIPSALATFVGIGVPLIRSLAKGRNKVLFTLWAILRWVVAQGRRYVLGFLRNYRERQDTFRSEDEVAARMMCVVAMGREASVGRFRLGTGLGDTPLRVKRDDGRKFHEDPVYRDIEDTLNKLATELRDPADPTSGFLNPFLSPTAGQFKVDSIALSHPLGGCRIAVDVRGGVVDEHGRAFKKSGGVYPGLYIADGSIVPTALGVNPSLTITALSLRIADGIVARIRKGQQVTADREPLAEVQAGV